MLNRPDFTVATLGELTTLQCAELSDGCSVWVVDQNDYFTLIKLCTLTVDNGNVLAPISGSPVAGVAGARWVRSSMTPDAFNYGAQATWYVNDTTGLVSNDGTSATQGAGNIGPVTFAEWARRIIAAGGVAVGVAMVVHVGSNITTMVQGTINTSRVGSTLQITGNSGITSLRTGTLTPVTACAPATNVPWSATDSGGNVWTSYISASSTTGKRVRITKAGANFGNIFWPAKDLGAGACRFSQPLAPIDYTLGAYGQTLGDISNNDTYVVEQLPVVRVPWGLSFYVDSYQGFVAGQESVQIIDLAFSNTNIRTVIASNSNYGIAFYGCDIGNNTIECPGFSLVNCRSVTHLQSTAASVSLLAGLNMGVEVLAGQFVVDQRHMIQSGRLALSGAQGAGATVCSVQAFDSTTEGISLVGGTAQIAAFLGAQEIFGSGNTTVGISVDTPNVMTYLGGKAGITITGGVGDTSLGGTTTAYAAIPKIVSDIAAGSGTTFAGLIAG